MDLAVRAGRLHPRRACARQHRAVDVLRRDFRLGGRRRRRNRAGHHAGDDQARIFARVHAPPSRNFVCASSRDHHPAVDPDDPVRGDGGNVSIVQLFVAGIMSGILGGLGMMAISYYLALRLGWPVKERLHYSAGCGRPSGRRPGRFSCRFVILGGIFGGFVTATEGAGLAVVAALLVGGA